MNRRLHKKLCFSFALAIFLVFVMIKKFWNTDTVLIIVGSSIKQIDQRLYAKFQDFQQENRMKWFNEIALDSKRSLHEASGWGYLSTSEYNDIVEDVLNNIPIRKCFIPFCTNIRIMSLFNLKNSLHMNK